MTTTADDLIRPRRVGAAAEGWRLALMIVGATVLALVMAAPLLPFVAKGGFGDPDDAMRMAEVRAWLGGQSWFDVTAMRLDPPTGASMHWSRLVDLPNGLLIRLFGLFVDPAQAEVLDRIVLPTLLLGLLYRGMARLAAILAGRNAQGVAIVGTLLSGSTLVQFQPGRIVHHAPDTVALVFAVGAALASLDPRRAREAGIAGALIALSLAMSLETMPVLAALCLVMVLAWVWHGATVAPALGWFGAGLGLALPPLFLVTVAPGHWLAPVADAFGFGHFGAGMIGAVGVLALARASQRLSKIWLRVVAAGLLGLAILAFAAGCAPEILHSPFADIDPLVRVIWLDNVSESQPLLAFMRGKPMLGLALALPVALGTAGVVVGAVTQMGLARLRFVGLGVLCVAGFGLGLWQIRAFTSVAPLALCGGVFAVARLKARLDTSDLTILAAFASLAILPFTATAWAVALPDDRVKRAAMPDCLAVASLAPLAALPAGRALAPLVAGAHLIEATALDVFAGPYHRNNDGNRFVLDAWGAAPDAAHEMLTTRQVTYVLTCPGMGDFDQMAARAPNGLAARLEAGAVPAFLTPVPIADTPFRVFRVAR